MANVPTPDFQVQAAASQGVLVLGRDLGKCWPPWDEGSDGKTVKSSQDAFMHGLTAGLKTIVKMSAPDTHISSEDGFLDGCLSVFQRQKSGY